jgi:GT2 family glycosyltransferase
MNDLSIVIVSWKMMTMLRELLQSIVQFSKDFTYEIIVVDNHSQDGTAEMIRNEFPSIVLIENPENRGVAPSRNQALNVAQGRYVLILDADTLLLENSFKKMIEFMDRTPDAGICSCKLISANHVVQPNARRYPSLLAFVLRRLTFIEMLRDHPVLNRHEMTDWDRSDVRDVDYVIGACQMIRDVARRQIGNLDEHIFYGPEDIDYCLRMYRKGWKVYYYPHTSIIHYEQRITKRKVFSKISYRHFLGIIYLFSKYGWRLTRT